MTSSSTSLPIYRDVDENASSLAIGGLLVAMLVASVVLVALTIMIG